MKCFMDLHTHTIASGHAYSTLRENVVAAQEMGLKCLGISDHGPQTMGGPNIMYFWNLKIVPRKYGDLKLLCGAEANITDFDGHLDLDDFTLSRIDYCIASMHTFCLQPGTAKENTDAAINAMKNPYVKILGHPDDARYPLEYDRLVEAALKEKVLLEINNSSLHPLAARQGARENILTLLRLCKEHKCPVILGTDSHICDTIGRFELTEELLQEVEFPQELIVNTLDNYWEQIVCKK